MASLCSIYTQDCSLSDFAIPDQQRLLTSTQAAPVLHPQELTVHWKSGIYAPTRWFSTTKVYQIVTAIITLYTKYGKYTITWNILQMSPKCKKTVIVFPVCQLRNWLTHYPAGCELLFVCILCVCTFWTSPQCRDQQLFLPPVQQLPDQWLQWQHCEDPGPAGGTPHLHPPWSQGDATPPLCSPADSTDNLSCFIPVLIFPWINP